MTARASTGQAKTTCQELAPGFPKGPTYRPSAIVLPSPLAHSWIATCPLQRQPRCVVFNEHTSQAPKQNRNKYVSAPRGSQEPRKCFSFRKRGKFPPISASPFRWTISFILTCLEHTCVRHVLLKFHDKNKDDSCWVNLFLP